MKTLEALIEGLKQAKEELSKAIKPGPTLDYSKINPKPDKETRAAAEAAAPTINYSNRVAGPNRFAGSAANTAAVRAKIDAEGKETAMETIARRQKFNKGEEPHKDDPHHERKEQDKAKKIKEEAQDILDMHKFDGDTSVGTSGVSAGTVNTNAASQIMSSGGFMHKYEGNQDMLSLSHNGQWDLKKAPVSEAQRKAMGAAASGHSNLGIPKNVGKEYIDKDPGGKLPEKANKAEDCYKADKESHSVFTMQHAHDVSSMSHHEGQAHLHKIVDASSATPDNKAKIKAAINNSKNPRHLSSMVANHVLAAGGAGHKPGSLKVLK